MTEQLGAVCRIAGPSDYSTIYATCEGFELYLGMTGQDYSYAIRCNESGNEFGRDRCPSCSELRSSLLDALYRVFNSNDDFDEDSKFCRAWVEVTEHTKQ